MRTNEERIAAMHKRAAELKKETRHRHALILSAASVAACFMLVLALAVSLPGMNTAITAQDTGEMSASLFAGSGALGFIVIGIIAFLLGVSVTVFCSQLKKWEKSKREPETQKGQAEKNKGSDAS